MQMVHNEFLMQAGLLVLATLLASGCAARPAEPPAPQLTLDLLKNAQFRHPIDDRYVQLIDGAYQEKIEPYPMTPTLYLWEHPFAFADLNGDGLEDVLVILDYHAGGSGQFRFLAAVLNQNGIPYDVAHAGLGDRTKIKGIHVDGKTIVLDVVTHRWEDGMCCPTLDATWQFRFEDGKLIP